MINIYKKMFLAFLFYNLEYLINRIFPGNRQLLLLKTAF